MYLVFLTVIAFEVIILVHDKPDDEVNVSVQLI